QLKTDFPKTRLAQNADQILVMIEQQKQSMKARAALKPGTVFSDFAEKDITGQPLSVARFKGKVVLVDFWATWCGPCVKEMPNVIAAYNKYHGKGFEIVGISLDRDESALRNFIKDKNMLWPQYFDGQGWQNKLSRKYGINSIPSSFLLDGQGKIIAEDLRGPELDAQLGKLLGP
ncbi:MAG: TlpA family protein disulfide reductase, partial [Verrucomicrobiota bacterium]|nr:TlpA family protein disulfide reductase [Verrucomicrobiota bacterium]